MADRPRHDPIDYTTTARNVLIYAELAQALRALDAAQVPAIVLKGAALVRTVYPSIADRPMVDADLLIRIRDGDRARAALQAAGFQVQVDTRRRFGLSATAFASELICWRTPLTQIELHWNLTASQWLLRPSALDVDALFKAAQPLEIEGLSTLQLSPGDTLLHLCLHMVSHGFAHPTGYADIVRVLDHYRPFPWDEFVLRAHRFRLAAVCYFPLEVITSTLATPVPFAVLAALRPRPWQQRLVRAIADPQRMLHGDTNQSSASMGMLYLAVADRPAQALAAIGWSFFPGPQHLAERYDLHGQLSPFLACLWHPFVVLWRGAANVITLARRS